MLRPGFALAALILLSLASAGPAAAQSRRNTPEVIPSPPPTARDEEEGAAPAAIPTPPPEVSALGLTQMRDPGCALPGVPNESVTLHLASGIGAGFAPLDLIGLGEGTAVQPVIIGSDGPPLLLILDPRQPLIWDFQGAIERVALVVVLQQGAASAVHGLPPGRVAFRDPSMGCTGGLPVAATGDRLELLRPASFTISGRQTLASAPRPGPGRAILPGGTPGYPAGFLPAQPEDVVAPTPVYHARSLPPALALAGLLAEGSLRPAESADFDQVVAGLAGRLGLPAEAATERATLRQGLIGVSPLILAATRPFLWPVMDAVTDDGQERPPAVILTSAEAPAPAGIAWPNVTLDLEGGGIGVTGAPADHPLALLNWLATTESGRGACRVIPAATIAEAEVVVALGQDAALPTYRPAERRVALPGDRPVVAVLIDAPAAAGIWRVVAPAENQVLGILVVTDQTAPALLQMVPPGVPVWFTGPEQADAGCLRLRREGPLAAVGLTQLVDRLLAARAAERLTGRPAGRVAAVPTDGPLVFD